MANDLIQQKKNQRNQIIILAVVLVITLFVVYQGFFKKEEKFQEEEILVQKPEIKINFDILDSPIFESFQPFYEIEPFVESTTTEETISVGRENPFLPY
jgi:hypothetical protein